MGPDRPRAVTREARDAPGRIYSNCDSAGGRKVAGSNPAAPTSESPLARRVSGSDTL